MSRTTSFALSYYVCQHFNVIPLRTRCSWGSRLLLNRRVSVHCHIPCYHARLIVNRHFDGSKHGLPLHERFLPYRLFNSVGNSVSQHARILNGQSLVLSVMS